MAMRALYHDVCLLTSTYGKLAFALAESVVGRIGDTDRRGAMKIHTVEPTKPPDKIPA
jgi:hypothetical protein